MAGQAAPSLGTIGDAPPVGLIHDSKGDLSLQQMETQAVGDEASLAPTPSNHPQDLRKEPKEKIKPTKSPWPSIVGLALEILAWIMFFTPAGTAVGGAIVTLTLLISWILGIPFGIIGLGKKRKLRILGLASLSLGLAMLFTWIGLVVYLIFFY